MKIAIFPAEYTEKRFETVTAVCELLRRHDAKVMTYKANREYCGPCAACGDFPAMMHECDFVIAVGGDGTVLHAARHAAEYGKPVLGINCGHLGYLSTLENSELELLEALFTGDYETEDRMMLNVEHQKAGGEVKSFYALNDAVLGGAGISKAIDVSVSCDGRVMYDFTGDGLVLSTPTGSTAYSFSAGGPVVDTKLSCVCVTPVCPHSFTLRSVIIASPSVVTVKCSRNGALLAVDGENAVDFADGDVLKVYCSERSAKFVRLKEQGFYDVLARKMDR